MAKKASDFASLLQKYSVDREYEMKDTGIETFNELWGGGICYGFMYGFYATPGAGKCLGLDSFVSTNKGYVSGQELTQGLSDGYHANNEIEVEQSDGSFEKISHLYVETDAQCRRIHSEYGISFTGTLDHPVLALSKDSCQPKMIKLKNLKPGDYILKRLPQLIEIKASYLECLKYFLYGYVVGDGCYSKSLFEKGVFSYNGTYKDLLWIRGLEEKLSNCYQDNSKSYAITGEDNNSTYKIPIHKSLLKDLIKDSQDAYTKTVDSTVFKSKDVALAFLLGYLAADGSRTLSGLSDIVGRGFKKNSNYEFSTSSDNLMLDLCRLCDYLSIVYKVYNHKTVVLNGKEFLTNRVTIPTSTLTDDFISSVQNMVRILELPESSRISRITDTLSSSFGRTINKCEIDLESRVEFLEYLRNEYSIEMCRNAKCGECEFSRETNSHGYVYPSCSIWKNISHLRRAFAPATVSKFLTEVKMTGKYPYLKDEKKLTDNFDEVNLSLYRDYYFVKITDIEETVEKVFDVTVPTTHLFMSSNIVNHNTSVCLQIVKRRLKDGTKCVIVDVEKSINDFQLESFGLKSYKESGDLLILTCTFFNEFEEIMMGIADSGEYKLVLVDSISAIQPYVAKGLTVEDIRPGIRALQSSQVINKIKAAFYQKEIASLMIFQARANLDMTGNMYAPKEKSAASYTERHVLDVETQISISSVIKDEEDKIIGNKVWIECKKNKFTAPFNKVQTSLIFGKGILKRIEIVDKAIELGIIQQRGSFFIVPGASENIRGRKALYDLPADILRAVKQAIQEK